MISNLQQFLDVLRREKQLCEITAPVDPYLEAAEIHRRVIAEGGPALLFRNIKGASFPLVTNLFGTERRMQLAFGSRPEALVKTMADLLQQAMPPSVSALWGARAEIWDILRLGTKKVSARASSLEVVDQPAGLMRLPLLTTWEKDGGPFFTLPLVYSEHPQTKVSNLGIYRLQRFDDSSTGFHCQIGKGAGFHLAEARRLGRKLPVNVAVGGPPAFMLAAAAPLPENVPELLLASLLIGRKVSLAKNPLGPLDVLAEAEFVLVGEVDPNYKQAEGPFGDHYGYYSLQHDYPVFKCKGMLRRKNAICTATVVGKGRQEDCFLGDYIQKLFAPLYPLLMPALLDLWAYAEAGYHSLAAAVVKQQRYKREAISAAFRILGEGQLSLTKFLLVVEEHQNLQDFRSLLEHVLERADFRSDLYVLSNTSFDTLDYTSTKVNEGSKAILLGLGEKRRELPVEFVGEFSRAVSSDVRNVIPFCRGCLVLDAPAYERNPGFKDLLLKEEALRDWPLIVLCDNARHATQSASDFLWQTFTRFDPALDLSAREKTIENNHVAFHGPLLIDARMKPAYPEELECDAETARLVSRRWGEYFN